ncbi:glucose dehydrogenase [FAD, quinone] [Plutella xylostella]|uniref:glucose dehydrogenase [FAD, quinone] n=1 Tax=Plutella xylostella TaxID=51655 RepID=UPI002032FD69|nr:glucose dehydrogenase [FAD, quinone] [Plutella xylostella]
MKMAPIHLFQFYLYSLCIHIFTIFVYLTYYSDLFTSSLYNQIKPHYDYIIVGSGTAGSLIAHRIATETNFTYLVIEAGGSGNAILDIPVFGPLLHRSVFDWQFETTPQEQACYAMKDKKCRLPQGKIVGGSAKLNNMVHVRGNISHYVTWFQGKYSKRYIIEQFKHVEKNILHLDNIRYKSILANSMLKAAKELSYKNRDVNIEYGETFMRSRVSQSHGKRWATSENLKYTSNLVTHALVEKVVIDKKNIARGVIISRKGEKYMITAKKGVIISAGTFNSPKILQLSGIGPRKLLDSLDIPVVQDLPVGYNLQDHVTTGLDLVTFNKSLDIGPDDMLNLINVFKYYVYGRGPLTSPGCEVVGFLSTKNDTIPDIQFMVLPVGLSSDRGAYLKNGLGVTEEVWNNYFVSTFNQHAATILPILLHPKSRGSVQIQSTDPLIAPLINPKYLTDEEDVNTLIKGLKFVKKFIDTKAMSDIGAVLNPNHFPGCHKYKLFSDAYFKCYIKHLTLTSYHPVGTCSMGLPRDKKSVVNLSFQVIGVKKLYVVDGSVLPTLPGGNINAVIAMMANLFFEDTIGYEIFCRNRNKLLEYMFLMCLLN